MRPGGERLGAMRVSLVSLGGNVLGTVDVESDQESVRQLQERVSKITGVPWVRQRLLHGNGLGLLNPKARVVEGPSGGHMELTLVVLPERKILTCAARAASLWSAETGERLKSFAHAGHVNSAVFSGDGASVLTASDDGTAKIWSCEVGACGRTLRGHKAPVLCALFAPDDELVLTSSADHTVRLWRAGTGECRRTLVNRGGNLWPCAFSPDSSWIFAATPRGTARLWSCESGACICAFEGRHQGVLSAVASADAATVLTAAVDGTAKVWSVATGACLRTIGATPGDATGARSGSPPVLATDGSAVLTVSDVADAAELWTVQEGAEGGLLLAGHQGCVWSAGFSPNGTSVITTSDDCTARLWDMTGTCTGVLQGHQGPVYSAVFSSDGEAVLTTSWDGTAKVWSTANDECLSTIPGHNDEMMSAALL